jgi:hypothetical protein
VNQEPNYANVSYRGVFSGAVSDEIRAPFGQVFIKVAVPKISTNSLWTNSIINETRELLFIMPVINQTQLVDQTKIIKLTIPAYSLLFIKQNQFVEHQQVLAEVSTLTEKDSSVESLKQFMPNF